MKNAWCCERGRRKWKGKTDFARLERGRRKKSKRKKGRKGEIEVEEKEAES